MRTFRKAFLAASALTLIVGCRAKRFADQAPTTGPMPANTIMLSAMMRQLSADPRFTDAFLKEIEGAQKKSGTALLTPDLIDHLRDQILGRDWQGLDRFPGWTMREINPTVRVMGHVAGKDEKVEGTATAGGAPSGTPGAPLAGKAGALIAFLDVGPYKLEQPVSIDFRKPSTLPGFTARDLVAQLGDGVVRGDGPSALAPEHAISQRLADALNRLSANGLPGVAQAQAFWNDERSLSTPQDLIEAIASTGNAVEVDDARYFANFGHLHFNGQDVMMPFWVNSQIVVPRTDRPLLVPVSHAEYEWHIRGPRIDADVSFYFGIDGKAEFRTMDQLDQPWVMKRNAHTYTGAEAMEVTRLNGSMVHTYAHLHAAHPTIPFGGYYAFGVCQDEVAAIELKLTGKTTLFPNTADASFFTDPADAEINDLIRRIPKDRDGKPPEPERIFGSLPVGSGDAELLKVSIPGLGPDLVAAHDAWTAGKLERVETGWRKWLRILGVPALAVLLLLLVVRMRMRR